MKTRMAEWILSQVLPPDRAASTIGDWLEDADERGPIWFWSCVLRTVLSRVCNDFAESPGFMVGLAIRGWLYSLWLIVGSLFGLLVLVFLAAPVVLFLNYVAKELHWQPQWSFPQALVAQIWIGWCQFQGGRWIARRAPGRELTAGIVACMAPALFFSLLGLLSMHFWGPEISQFLASHPGNPGSVPTTLPSEFFLLAGIFWSRHKSLQSVAA